MNIVSDFSDNFVMTGALLGGGNSGFRSRRFNL
jgi:hypothetical protein